MRMQRPERTLCSLVALHSRHSCAEGKECAHSMCTHSTCAHSLYVCTPTLHMLFCTQECTHSGVDTLDMRRVCLCECVCVERMCTCWVSVHIECVTLYVYLNFGRNICVCVSVSVLSERVHFDWVYRCSTYVYTLVVRGLWHMQYVVALHMCTHSLNRDTFTQHRHTHTSAHRVFYIPHMCTHSWFVRCGICSMSLLYTCAHTHSWFVRYFMCSISLLYICVHTRGSFVVA